MIRTKFIADDPLSLKWLAQFEASDIDLARSLLRTLELVSFAEFESAIRRLLEELPKEDGGRIALFPVKKPVTIRWRKPHRRRRYSSAGRIGHLLTNLEKEHPREFVANPTVHSMRGERTKHIVFVDDFIGSGTRISKFWKEEVSRSIKSWVSCMVCKVWIIAYAAHPSGIKYLKRKLSFLKNEDIRIHLALPARFRNWNNEIIGLCQKYGAMTRRPEMADGFGDIMAPLVFQHGCPNNAPVMLWSDGHSWRGLFPERSIPIKMYKYFRDDELKGWHGDLLADSNQYKLGLRMLERITEGRISAESENLFTMLGLLLQKIRFDKLPGLMFCSRRELDLLRAKAEKFFFIDPNGKVTDFGRDLVYRFKNGNKNPDKLNVGTRQIVEYYFPKQFTKGSAKV